MRLNSLTVDGPDSIAGEWYRKDDVDARIAELESAIKNALGILAASFGDADPYVRSASDLLWQALEEHRSENEGMT